MQGIVETVLSIEYLGLSRDEGQTVPLYLRCRTAEVPIVYQIKVVSQRSALSEREMCAELLGTLLSQQVGLQAAHPSVVHLTNGVRAEIETKHSFGIGSEWAIGFQWVMDLIPFAPRVDTARVPPTECARLLALDLLMANGDRTSLNPNVAWRSDALFVFDFEHCLEFRSGSSDAKMELHLSLLDNFVDSHVLGSRAHDLAPLVLSQVDLILADGRSTALEGESESLPESWRSCWYDLVGYMEHLRANRTLVLERIKEILE